MSDRYEPSEIEPKWQAHWEREQTFLTDEDPSKPKAYVLDMFPYPSGAGLHVGHPEGYTASDIVSRYLRAKGRRVLHPMGWDAFGLPAEQHAIKTGTHPRATTAANIETFRRQLKMLGFSYDWTREVDTTDPAYVRWTQWIFLRLFHRGLAYQDEITVNWCPALGTVLANEEVIGGVSERGGHPVERTPLRQWVLKITAYADRLLGDLEGLEWPNSTMTMQKEWIGRSEGAEVRFEVEGLQGETLEIFTTRPDTLFGATFMVLAPEHPLVAKVTSEGQRASVEAYVEAAKSKSDRDRQQSTEKTGAFTGGYAINPVNGARVPIWIADYVLMGYGTGAIMAVPAHDERDFEFATKFGIPIVEVVSASGKPSEAALKAAMTEPGVAVNSGAYDGLGTAEFKAKITADLEREGRGRKRIEYKLRDWVFSRQRYWGEPIPVYFPVETAGDPRKGDAHTIRFDQPIAVDDSELPLRLPELEDYQPGADPAGVLARALDWRFFQRDGRWYARETNTMPQWAGSCWYYLRFTDPRNDAEPWSKEAAKKWLPVDLYVGGAEHAVLHLLYARFWHKVLFDEGVLEVKEPFQRLVHQGMILGEIEYAIFRDSAGNPVSADEVKDAAGKHLHKKSGEELSAERIDRAKLEALTDKRGSKVVLKADPSIALDVRAHKMSKSRGNVVNPDDIVREFGADSLRLYEMFMGPLEATKPWNTESIHGVRRFLDRVWQVATRTPSEDAPADALLRLTHRTIRKVTEDIDAMRFNTAISAMMVLNNEMYGLEAPPRAAVEALVVMLHPFAPHVAEELWARLGHSPSVQAASWPAFDPALCEEAVIEVPVQVNGKVKGRIQLAKDADEAAAMTAARADEGVARAIEGKNLVKTIYVPGRILTLVAK